MSRIEFSVDDDGTFLDICMKALADHGVAVKITTTDNRFPSWKPCEILIDMWHTQYVGVALVSGRVWNPATEEYNGLPVFIDTASIDKVEVI
jgi:hypothetical protein